jgi:predicted DNA-binding transcriptional regulator YafY
MIGYCRLRNEVRVFALDRIKMLHQTKESFDVAKDFDFDEFMRPSFGVYQGKPVKGRIWFSPDAAGYIKEKIWHDTQEILPQKDGSIVFEAEVAGTEDIKFWVMSWGAKALVLEPDSLRQEIRAESEALLGKYGGDLVPEEKPSVA